MTLVYAYHFVSIKKLKRSVRFQRVAPPKGKENEKIKIGYRIFNSSAFNFYNFTLINNFEGHIDKYDGTHWLKNYSNLPAHTKRYIERDIELNNGMGEKKFDNFYFFITDELGIHRLKYESQETTPLNVYPRVHGSPPDKIIPDPTSRSYGNFDTYQRGENVNFYGVREYTQGDNIKKINWKLSLKHGNIIVNEFEKNVNGKIFIALNEDQRIHVGDGANGTLEYCKDLTLSLAHQHLRNNNEIGFSSHQFNTVPSCGPSHVRSLELKIGKLEVQEFERTQLYHRGARCPKEIQKFAKKITLQLDKWTTFYFISGYIPGKLYRYYSDYFPIWSRQCHRMVIINVNGLSQMVKQAEGSDLQAMHALLNQVESENERLATMAKHHHFEVKTINIDDSKKYQNVIKEGLQFR